MSAEGVDMIKTSAKRLHFAWIILLGMCVVMGLTRGGLNNAGGLFMAPVTTDLGFGTGEFSLYFSISSVATFLFLPVAGRLMARYDPRLLLITSLIFQAGSFALFGCMDNIWGWYLLSVPMAAGSVITTQIAGPVLVGRWFKEHNGLAVGIIMAAVGLFGMILQPMAGNLIAHQGWRQAYILLGLIVMALGIPVVLLTIRKEPIQMGLRPLGEETAIKQEKAIPEGVTEKDARKSASFWALALFMFFITAVAAFGQHIPQYANQLGYDTAFAGGAMGFFMLGMLIGSLFFGVLSDKIGTKATTIFALISGIAAVIIAILGGSLPYMFDFAVTLFGFMSASVGTLGPLLTTDVFGSKEYGEIYSIVAMGMAFGGIVALPGYGFVYDAVGSYYPVLWGIIGLLIACIICVMIAFAGKEALKQKGLWG